MVPVEIISRGQRQCAADIGEIEHGRGAGLCDRQPAGGGKRLRAAGGDEAGAVRITVAPLASRLPLPLNAISGPGEAAIAEAIQRLGAGAQRDATGGVDNQVPPAPPVSPPVVLAAAALLTRAMLVALMVVVPPSL